MLKHAALAAVGLLIVTGLLTTGVLTEAREDPWIHGHVLGAQGKPVADADVRLRVPQGDCRHVAGAHIPGHAVTDEDGAFRIPAPPGAMEVYVRHPDHAPGWGEARDGVTVELRDAAWIEGEINVPAVISVTRGPWRYASVHVEGTFRVGPLPSGEVVTLAAASETHRPYFARLVLEPGESHATNITLARGVALEGRVEPAHAGAVVRAHQNDGRESIATTSEDGSFTVTGLEEGWVRLVVLSPGRPPAILDASAGESESVIVRWK